MREGLWIVLILAAALAVVIWDRLAVRRVMGRLDRMLQAAMDGSFREKCFDESRLSAVETRMAAFVSGSVLAAQNQAAEKETIQTLISDISHQTKTPVANLVLYAQLLLEQPLPPESRKYVEALTSQTEKLQFLIDALVKMSRLETGILTLHPRQEALMPMLEAAVAQYRPRAETKGLTLTLEPTAAWAAFDPKWTAEAVENLLDNAVKYTPVGGRICVRVRSYELFCRVDVEDTGHGIAEAEQARVFQRFYRSEATRDVEGVGVGLYLTRQIMAGQGGYVKVSSRPGRGSTFSLFLPRGDGKEAEQHDGIGAGLWVPG